MFSLFQSAGKKLRGEIDKKFAEEEFPLEKK